MTEIKLHTAGRRHKSPLTTDVFTAARQRMKYVYETFDVVVVSWSGGKDSTCCLELAREAATKAGRLPVKIMFLDEEVIYPETFDLIDRHVADPDLELNVVNIPSIYRNACSEVEPNFIPWDPEKKALWTHEPYPNTIWPFGTGLSGVRVTQTISAGSSGFAKMWGNGAPDWTPELKVAQILGLRTEESFARYGGILSSGSFISGKTKGHYRVRPIYDWKARDVWLAIKENGWDYNRAYEKLWRAGGNPISTRVAPLFHAEAAMNLRTVMLFWPQFWSLVRARVRGAHAVAIYNGALHAVERLPGEDWKKAAERYLNTLGSVEDQEQLHTAVQQKIYSHYRHSPFDIPDEIDCPECGLSWKLIARAVARGDRQLRILNPNKGLVPMNKKRKTNG